MPPTQHTPAPGSGATSAPTQELAQSGGKKLSLGQIASLESIVIGVLIVVGLAFILFLMQSFTASQMSYEELKTRINQEDTQIQLLTNEIKDLKDFMRNCNAWRTSAC
ncbi:MAG TPA: hypothetical protein VGP13_00670 [Candidatus Paceibacterota bacterium]|jgi:cell division protein FtsL|nr:hypothetical protein [Candidatus Paceibacterota bacterium]